MQRKVVDGADAHVFDVGGCGGVTVHERAAGVAPAVGHAIPGGGRRGLAPFLDLFLSTDISDMGVLGGEVGGEHGRRYLAAVGAVADEGVDQAFARSRLKDTRSVYTLLSFFHD